MAIDYHKLKAWRFDDVESTYTKRDTMLYALGLGLGAEATNPAHLRYVYEQDLHAFPTMAVTLGYPGLWVKQPESGVDWIRMLHGEQALTLHKPLPIEGTIIGRNRVAAVIDKGPGKGALLVVERELYDQASGDHLASLESVSFCRGDGGYSQNANQPSDPARPAPVAMPPRPYDHTVTLATRPEAALLYRLSGDMNPVHADPGVARQAGFEKPILHGLATYGIAARALLDATPDPLSARLKSIRARFSAPAYPGDTIRAEIWSDGARMLFRCVAAERDVVVLNNGEAIVENIV